MRLYHYCSNAAFLSIISNKEIWTSDFSLTNDAMEGRWIREIFSECCKESKVYPSHTNDLLRHLDLISDFFGAAGFCMSEQPDLLSQWRAYADNGAGVSIGFNRDYFERLGSLRRDRGEKLSASIQRVEYEIQSQKKRINDQLQHMTKLIGEGALRTPTLANPETPEEKNERQKKYLNLGMHFLLYFPILYTLKNPAFSEEKEWRVISYIFRGSAKEELDQIEHIHFRAAGDKIIPFGRLPLEPLDLPSISEVVIGPKNLTPTQFVHDALKKHGWKDIEIRRSAASYR